MKRMGSVVASVLSCIAIAPRAVADLNADITALRDEIDARIENEDFGELEGGGRGGKVPPGLALSRDILQSVIDGAEPGHQFGQVIFWMRTAWPDEYEPSTPGDISDLTDPLLGYANQRMRSELDARLEFIDGQIEIGKSCGHRGNEDGAKKLSAASKWGHAQAGEADAAPSDTKRFDALLEALQGVAPKYRRVPDETEFEEAALGGWLPPDDGTDSRMTSRIAPRGPSLGASTEDPDSTNEPSYDTGTLTGGLEGSVLSLRAHCVPEDWLGDMGDPEPIIDIDLVVAGATGEKKFTGAALDGSTVTFSTYTGVYDENDDPVFDVDVYDIHGGSLRVKEFCPDRMSGTFTLRFKARAADSETGDDIVFTMNRGKFSVYTGK